MADMGGAKLLSPTPGATITLTIDTTVRHLVASWTSGEVETVNISGTPLDGQQITLLITNDATLGRVITLGAGFSANGTIVGVISKRSIWFGIAVGGVFYEVARTVGVLT